MRVLKEFREKDLVADYTPPSEPVNYWSRKAARAVIFYASGEVALMHVTKKNYYKLPGGGLEEGETLEQALKRECREEAGVEIEILQELGLIIEYRETASMIQKNYGYLTRVRGAIGRSHFTKKEEQRNFKSLWLPVDEAVNRCESVLNKNYWGTFAVPRALTFLKTAQPLKEKALRPM